jgi:hypothetical protein
MGVSGMCKYAICRPGLLGPGVGMASLGAGVQATVGTMDYGAMPIAGPQAGMTPGRF